MTRRLGLTLVLVGVGLLVVLAGLMLGSAREGLRRGPSPAALLGAGNLHRPVFQARGSDRILVAVLGGLLPGRLRELLPAPPPPPKGIRGVLVGRYLARCAVPAHTDEFLFGLATGWSLRGLQQSPVAFSLAGHASPGPSFLAGFEGSGAEILLSGPLALHGFMSERVRFREILGGDPGEAAQSARQVALRWTRSRARRQLQIWAMGPLDGSLADEATRAAQASVLSTAVADVTVRGGLVVVMGVSLGGAPDGRTMADLAFIGPGVRDRPDGVGAPPDLDLSDVVATVALQARVAQPPVCLGLPVSDVMDVYEGERRGYLVESVIQANERQIPVLINARFGVTGTPIPVVEAVGGGGRTATTDRHESDWRRSRHHRLRLLAASHAPTPSLGEERVAVASVVLVLVGACALAGLALSPAPIATAAFAVCVGLAVTLGVASLEPGGEAAVWAIVAGPPALPSAAVVWPLVLTVLLWGGVSVWRSWSGVSSWKAFAAVGLLPPVLPLLVFWLFAGDPDAIPLCLVAAGLACGAALQVLPGLLFLVGLLVQARAGRARVAAAAVCLGLLLGPGPCWAEAPLLVMGPGACSWPLERLSLTVRAIEPLAEVTMRLSVRNGGSLPAQGVLLVEPPPGTLRCSVDGVEAIRRGALRSAVLGSVGPGEVASAVVTWVAELPADEQGRRVLDVPLAGLGPIPEFTLAVTAAPLPGRAIRFGEAWFGLPWTLAADGTLGAALRAPLHDTSLADLTLRFTGEEAAPSHVLVRSGEAGLMILRFDAPAPAPVHRSRWILLVDVSASMAGEGRGLITFLRGLGAALAEGVPDCRIQVLAFDATVAPVATVSPVRDSLFDRFEPMVRRWFGGATDLGLALGDLGDRVRASREPQGVVLLTDGVVTQGPSEPAALAGALGAWPRRHRLDVLGLGASPSRRSLEFLARIGGGRFLALGPVAAAEPARVAAILRTAAPATLRLRVGGRSLVLADPWPVSSRVVAAPASLLTTAVVEGAPPLELTVVDLSPAFESLLQAAAGPPPLVETMLRHDAPIASAQGGPAVSVAVAALRARREPWNPSAHENLARALAAVGQRDEALRALGGMADAAPDDPAVLRRAADLAASLGGAAPARRLRWRAAGR